MAYTPERSRYDRMTYRRCGRSGLQLPAVSLGLWHNFGGVDSYETGRRMIRRAFDAGITHFDLANNYGPPGGSAELNFGRTLAQDFKSLRDELVISTKAGYYMWPGPYGDGGSRKYLISSLDNSLKRMGLDYVDIFYHHRFDPETPVEETMMALDQLVRQGKALYIGLSNYSAEQSEEAFSILRHLGTPCLIQQPRYSMLERQVETSLLAVLERHGVGCIAYSPLAQGLLSDRYLKGIPDDSRAAKPTGFLKKDDISQQKLDTIIKLNNIAGERGQSLAQMAIAWILRDARVTSVLIGASSIAQLDDNLKALNNIHFDRDELEKIDQILGS
ncbi:MAG: L-glyceraldehyde 3-phosphate reductase [Bacteroidales bacterium]|nr:L-glyceraldehyde 3-phosphate reductase [Bacteroidales bacterium]